VGWSAVSQPPAYHRGPCHCPAGLQLDGLAQNIEGLYPQAAILLLEAEEDILVYKTFPREHWRRIHSTNPLERLHKEVKRRTKVVGVFPDQASVLRLVGMNLKEIDDDWRAGRHYFQQDSMQLLKNWKSVPEKGKTSFLVNVITDLSLEAQSNLHH
jgi:transposase-like protein